ncbi:MAG: hypothetical protein ACREJQ_03365, partial [bacterium]
MKYRFQPPRDDPFIIGMMNFLFPAAMLVNDRLVRVTVRPEDWQVLEQLRNHRATLTPNHPSETEPVVLAWMA